MNRSIKSDMKSDSNFFKTGMERRTAREFFSKDNQDHPLIQENVNL
jgi:hypothetical protein